MNTFENWYLNKVGISLTQARAAGVEDIDLLRECWLAGHSKGYLVGFSAGCGIGASDSTGIKPAIYVKTDDLADLLTCNGRSVWAESPHIHYDDPASTATGLTALYLDMPPVLPT